jgi:Glutathione-dependent formaldehyde-activating enzyme
MTKSTTCGGTGRCLCGAVQYRYEGEPTTIGLCQCERCQRQSGSAFLIGVIFPKEAVTLAGPLATYEACIDGKHRLWRFYRIPGLLPTVRPLCTSTPEAERSETRPFVDGWPYTGTKLETADTAKGAP